MNLTVIKIAARKIFKTTVFFVKKHAPELLVGTGVAGFVATAVTTGTATVKAKEVLDKKDSDIQYLEDAIAKGEIAKEDGEKEIKKLKRTTKFKLIKIFSKPVAFGVVSGCLVVKGNAISIQRGKNTLKALNAKNLELHRYRSNVVQQLGNEIDKKLSAGEEVNKNDIVEKLKKKEEEERKKIEAPEEYAKIQEKNIIRDRSREKEWLFASETCGPLHGGGVWRSDPLYNKRYLENALQSNSWVYDMLKGRGWLLINDILVGFGADPTSYGATHGWLWYEDPITRETPTISFGLTDLDDDRPGLINFLRGAEPNVWLKFNCLDYDITEEIDKINAKRNYIRGIGVHLKP